MKHIFKILLIIGLMSPLIVLADDAEFKKLYEEGVEHVKKGRYNEAYVSFEKAIKASPSSELARFCLKQTGDLLISEMLANPELKYTAIRLIDMAKGSLKKLVATDEEIAKWVEQLKGSFDKKWEAVNMLATIGQRSCPALIDKLSDPDENIRTNVIQALEKINLESILPLIQSLKSESALTRQNAAIILGIIRDERSLAPLKEAFENPKESPQVKAYIGESLKKITGLELLKLKAAKEYYYQIAEKYYYAHPSVMGNFYGEYFFWKWDADNNKLLMQDVPDFIFNEELAEDACYSSLALDPNYEPIWPLLVCVYLAEYNEAERMLEVARDKSKRGEITEEDFNKLSTDLTKAKKGVFLASLVSKQYIYQALSRVLKDNNASVAVSCIELLKSLAEPQDLPLRGDSPDKAKVKIGLPLVEALAHQDKRVKYAAAEAIMRINPNKAFNESDKVIPIINETIGEMVERVVLLIEPESESRNELKRELTKLNCYTIETVNAEDGLANAKRFPSKDLIIINSKLANQVVFSVEILGQKRSETVYDSLKEDVRTKGVPICLVGSTSDIESAKQIFQETVQGYLTTPVNRDVLKELTEKAFQTEKVAEDSKRRAERTVRLAIEALAKLELKDTIYPYRETIDALASTLANRPDSIRTPAIAALGRFGDALALAPLKSAFINTENSKEIRIQAVNAMADIFRVNPIDTINKELYDTLKNGLMESELEIQEACAKALGNAKLTLTQQRELFLMKK